MIKKPDCSNVGWTVGTVRRRRSNMSDGSSGIDVQYIAGEERKELPLRKKMPSDTGRDAATDGKRSFAKADLR